MFLNQLGTIIIRYSSHVFSLFFVVVVVVVEKLGLKPLKLSFLFNNQNDTSFTTRSFSDSKRKVWLTLMYVYKRQIYECRM